jgi:uncharacterized protein YijF (DUF1287 family)
MGDMHVVESTLRFPVTAGSVMGDMQALQDQKDWLNKKLLQYEDALRRIAYPKGDSPKSPEATIAFEALNHSKP